METPGFIYVIQMTGSPFYKIGRSSNVPRRMSEIGIQLPFPYRLCFAYRVPEANYTETQLHHAYAAFRRNGEWFRLTPADLIEIQHRLLFVQAESLIASVIKMFTTDDLYPGNLKRYGRLFYRLAQRSDRRLNALVISHQKPGAEVLVAEAVS